MKNLILKNMEALFLAALVTAAGANFAAARIVPPHHAHAAVQRAAIVDGNVYTVTVSAPRPAH